MSSMEPNKFASILHKKTNRITVVLVYTFLEWVLIFFLLLNSFFFFLIIKFARYFGLKPPCLICSRLDHVLEKQSSESSYMDLICENHAIQLSKSGLAIDCKISSFGVLEDTQKGNLISRDGNVDLDETLREKDDSDGVLFKEDDAKLPQHLEFYVDHDDHRLIPVGLLLNLDLEKTKSSGEKIEKCEKSSDGDHRLNPVGSLNLDLEKSSGEKIEVCEKSSDDELAFEPDLGVASSSCLVGETDFAVADVEATAIDDFATEDREVKSIAESKETEEELHNHMSITVEINEHELKNNMVLSNELKEIDEEMLDEDGDLTNEELKSNIPIPDCNKETCVFCEAPTDSCLPENAASESKETEEELENNTSVTVEISENEPKEIDKERIPDTPTSIDSLQNLHKKAVSLERTVNEEVLDGDGDLTNEELKFRALYGELEEERNAATIATSHTMAMINRLQEEKAIIEMEALQYQRMMEEQAEYDQEALQLMNELLVKREREKKELEDELELSRKKVTEYEEMERIRLLNQKKNARRNSSASSSNGLSVDLNNVSREEDNGQHNILADQNLNMQESLCCFEEERLSILEQLKVLEEKLSNLAEEEDQQILQMKPFEQFCLNGGANGMENGSFIKDENQLVSLYDTFDGVERLDPLLLEEVSLTRFGLEKRRISLEEEVEHVYERLHALEEDKEFIKDCISSLRKGDRGVELLGEILQHLRDLKNIECRTRNVDGLC